MKKKATKRKAAAAKDETAAFPDSTGATVQVINKEPAKVVGRKPKRYKLSKPDLDELWKVSLVGTEWEQLDLLSESKWNFKNLEDAFDEGGVLHEKKVHLFTCTEPQFLFYQGQYKVTYIPVVVVIDFPFPPSNKIGIKSVQRELEEILDMQDMKMDWFPYIPLELRTSSVERLDCQIYILGCVQRKVSLKHLKLDRVKKFEYCLPYFLHPLKEDETEQSTIVDIMYPIESKPVVCEFDWDADDLEDFTDALIAAEELSEDQKDAFKEFVKEKVREGKRANREAREKRKKARAETSQEEVAALHNMKIYKFYPVATLDTPDISSVKSPFINRYYGKAHEVL